MAGPTTETYGGRREVATEEPEEELTLAGVLRRTREQRGLSARQLSKLAGLSESYVQKLEAGTLEEPSLRAFLALCTALELNQREILVFVYTAMKGMA